MSARSRVRLFTAAGARHRHDSYCRFNEFVARASADAAMSAIYAPDASMFIRRRVAAGIALAPKQSLPTLLSGCPDGDAIRRERAARIARQEPTVADAPEHGETALREQISLVHRHLSDNGTACSPQNKPPVQSPLLPLARASTCSPRLFLFSTKVNASTCAGSVLRGSVFARWRRTCVGRDVAVRGVRRPKEGRSAWERTTRP